MTTAWLGIVNGPGMCQHPQKFCEAASITIATSSPRVPSPMCTAYCSMRGEVLRCSGCNCDGDYDVLGEWDDGSNDKSQPHKAWHVDDMVGWFIDPATNDA